MADVPWSRLPDWLPAIRISILAALVVSAVAVRRLERSRGWARRRRSRLLLGVPWGTLVSVAGVLAVYLFVQGGWSHWFDPVTVAFRAWSYLYPLGVVIAPFAHFGVSHLVGNLLGAVALGSLAEYAWGHFPRERGSTTFSSPATDPYVRAFVAFPAGVAAVGVLTGVFSWGPIIGFSGVVFAFAGFSLVRYPLGTVVALAVDDVLGVIYRALREPVVVSEAKPRFGQPWWAGIAVQGHLLGLFLGVVAGALVLRRRREPGATRRWAGTLIVATSLSLWALWWFRGNAQYVLFRGIGVVFVFALALLVTVGLRAAFGEGTLLGLSRRQAGVLLLALPVLVIAGVAIPLNLGTMADPDPPGDGPTIEIRDYRVTYAENVTNQLTSVINVSVLGETTRVRASGLIVVSEERNIWTTAVSTSRLAFAGTASVPIGGPGWRRTVTVTRRGWSAVGNGTAYRVWIRLEGGDWRLAFRSEPVVAEPTLAGKRVAVIPRADGVFLQVRRNGTAIGRAPLPRANETTVAAGIAFVRDGDAVFATLDDTRVRVATKERYRGE